MEGKVKLTEEQGKELTDRIERQGLERIKSGALRSEADFYAGAAIAIHHLFGKDDKQLTDIIPPMWILGIMSGRSPSTRWEEDEGIKIILDAGLERQHRLQHNAELMYEFVTDMWDTNFVTSGYTPHEWLQERRVIARTILEDIGLYDFWSEEE